MRKTIRAGLFRRLLVWFLMTLAATASAQRNASVSSEMPKSHNPLSAYLPNEVPEPGLTNSPLLGQLIRDDKLYLSLKDAIRLALENNLDLAIARYNLPIANTDILRTKAGGVFRGVNAGVVQGTPGGGVGGFGAGAPGGGAGGTTASDRHGHADREHLLGLGQCLFCEGIHFYDHGEWELALDSVFFTLKAVNKDVPIDLYEKIVSAAERMKLFPISHWDAIKPTKE